MPQDPKRRQKSLQRKTAKRKEKKRAIVQARPASSRSLSRSAARWPLYECVISKNWQDPHFLAEILVARRSPEGEIAAAVFLVDLGCLGVKNAMLRLLPSRADYEEDLRSNIGATSGLKSIDLNCAAKIIGEAIAYARELGFSPSRDYPAAATLLGDADPGACKLKIPHGLDGKPFFVAGPYDNVPRIMQQLTRKFGPDNFLFAAPLPLSGDPGSFLLEGADEFDEEP
ncbi:MAG: hypothetical protein ACR2PL_14940 [Dehalococcoidia bacterium]